MGQNHHLRQLLFAPSKILHTHRHLAIRGLKAVRKSKIDPYLGRIQEILKQDKALPKKQRHTAKRIMERLKSEGFGGGYTAGNHSQNCEWLRNILSMTETHCIQPRSVQF